MAWYMSQNYSSDACSEVSTFSSQKGTHFQSLLLIDNMPFAGKSVQGQETQKYNQSL